MMYKVPQKTNSSQSTLCSSISMIHSRIKSSRFGGRYQATRL